MVEVLRSRGAVAGGGEAQQDALEPALDSAKRRQIMEGARRVFLDHGFDGASIADIVRAAGVSKGTLYAYFPSKETLFETLIIEDRRKQAEVLFVLDEENADVAAVLRRLGVSFMEMMLQPESLAFQRIVIGAAPKFPEIGKAFYTAGPCYGTKRLAAYFRRMNEAGVLHVENVELAARHFLDLCKSGLHLGLLLEATRAPGEEEIAGNVDAAIRVFLSAYGARAN